MTELETMRGALVSYRGVLDCVDARVKAGCADLEQLAKRLQARVAEERRAGFAGVVLEGAAIEIRRIIDTLKGTATGPTT